VFARAHTHHTLCCGICHQYTSGMCMRGDARENGEVCMLSVRRKRRQRRRGKASNARALPVLRSLHCAGGNVQQADMHKAAVSNTFLAPERIAVVSMLQPVYVLGMRSHDWKCEPLWAPTRGCPHANCNALYTSRWIFAVVASTRNALCCRKTSSVCSC
jgi:hypothetical protein